MFNLGLICPKLIDSLSLFARIFRYIVATFIILMWPDGKPYVVFNVQLSREKQFSCSIMDREYQTHTHEPEIIASPFKHYCLRESTFSELLCSSSHGKALRTITRQHSMILHHKYSLTFYLYNWLLGCSHGVEGAQLAWKESWSCVLTQDQTLRWRNLQEGRGREVGPPKPCPRAWVPETARARSHLDNSG